MANKKSKKGRNIFIGIVIFLALALFLTFSLTVAPPAVGFTPIFCNDYEFTCCGENKGNIQFVSITDEKPYTCPSYAYRCEIISVTPDEVGTTWYVGSSNCRLREGGLFTSDFYICDNEIKEKKEMKPNDKLYLAHQPFPRGFNTDGGANIVISILRLSFCGDSACHGGETGIPISGADQCKFNPENAKIYTTAGQLNDAVSWTVPTGECVLSFQRGSRHICGYHEETCFNDCGGHTYGQFECTGRTLQEYGCVSFGESVPLEKDRKAGIDGDFGGESQESVFGERCEIISANQVQCCGDNDCGTKFFCDRETWTCEEEVECSQNVDCGVSVQCDAFTKNIKTPLCISGTCDFREDSVECCSDVNCPAGTFCNIDNECDERLAVCQICPYECCEDECELSGGYQDKECVGDTPFCVDNACSTEDTPDTICQDCDDFAKSQIFGSILKSQQCKPKILQGNITCVFSLIKMLLVPIVFIIALLFGSQIFSEIKTIKKNKLAVWGFSLIIALLLATLIFFTFVVGIIVAVIYLIIRAVIGRKKK